jgi:long-chain acyl-CoA synthetase
LEALKAQGFDFALLGQAEGDARVTKVIDAEIKRLVCRESGFKPFEFVSGWRFLPKPFEVGDELTATFKPRRHIITEKYAALIDDIFQHSRGARRH